jgi:RHS repeat-associated protein
MVSFALRTPARGGSRTSWLRVWAPLVASLVVVLGLGCSLGGDGGAGGVEALGASHGASVSDTAPLACPSHATPTIPGGLLPPTPAEAEVAGSIAGSFEVNDAGAAVYSLRLEVPPGRAGIEPDLTLTYDSDHENGLLGMGFRLGALSSIRRCGHSFSDEGDLRAVAFDENDRFCLDGKKLFAVRGAYGREGTEYRTDPDVFTRVTQQGNAGNGPLAFTAFAPDGRIYQYGTTLDARVGGAHGAVATWSLAEVRDRLGNVMTYAYEAVPTADGAHQHRLTAIRYTGHASGLVPERSVEFDYDQRFDVLTKYVAGEAYRVGELLTGVRMYGPGHALVRDYTFTYSESPSTRRARLAQVVECAGEGPNRACKPATTFGWGDQPSGFSPDGLPREGSNGVRVVAVRTGDFNGDGTDDLAYLVDDAPPPDGGPPSQALAVKYTFGRPALDATTVVRTFAPSDTLPPYRDITPLDFDKDGRVDLLLQRPGTPTNVARFRWLRSTGTGFVDADDEAGVPHVTAPSGFHETTPTSNTTTYFADLNGDGLADVVSCGFGRRSNVPGGPVAFWVYQLQLPDARAFGEVKPLSYGLLPGGTSAGPLSSLDRVPCRPTDVVTLDLDGDGTSELLFAERGRVGTTFQALSVRADGALVEHATTLPAFESEARSVALDFNGDGLRDLVVLRVAPTLLPHDTEWVNADVYVNTGAGLRFVTTFDGDAMHFVHFRHGYVVLDHDGDGREDLLLRADGFDSGWRLLQEVGPGSPTHLAVTQPDLPFLVPFDAPIRSHYLALDVDADGDDDVVTVDDQVETVLTNARDELRQDRLLWVRDGRRASSDDVAGGLRAMTLRVDYDFLVDRTGWPGQDPAEPARYRHDPAACAPAAGPRALRCFAGEKRVVTHTFTGGNGAEKLAHDFFYQDARTHRLGAGWLGFGARQIVDRTRQRVTELAYDNQAATAIPLPGRPVDAYPYVERFFTAGRPVSALMYTDPFLGAGAAGTNVSDVDYVTHHWRTALAEGGATAYVLADESHAYRFQLANFRADAPHPSPRFGPFDPNAHPPLAHALSEVLAVDAFGNVLRARSDDGLVEATTVRTFDDDATAWLLGRATSATETSRPLGPNAAPAQTRTSTVTYQPGTPLPSTLGVSDPSDPTATLTETRTYDAFGNLTYRDRVDNQGRRRQLCVAYEPEGIYPSVVTQAAGHETRLVYDRALGVPLASLDPNGLATRWSYDPFGRTTRALTPEGGETTITRTRVVLDDPTTLAHDPVRFTQVDVRSSGAERRELWSAEGRRVRTEARAFSGLFGATRSYDRAGRLVADEVPTLVDRPAPGRRVYAYDGFDRPTAVTDADGLVTTAVYEGLTTRTVERYTPGGLGAPPSSPLERTRRLEHDGRGRVTRSVDARDQATVYAYGAFDHLRSVTDPAGHVTTYGVDALGRTRSVDDPDRGARSLTYTAFGQLETLTDAKGQVTRFVYDGLGRPIERHDIDGTSFFGYDEVPFGIGKLNRSNAAGGAERALTYDSKGRLATSQLRASLGDTPLTFTYGYDDAQFGRLRTLTYPVPAGAAPFRVRYGYDAFGHLERLTDDVSQAELWRQLAPDAALADRQTRERFGNGIETTRSFEPTSGLLTQLRSVKPAASGGAETVRQDLHYRYTHHRLLWQIDDALQGPSARETFGYDVLDRLTLDAVQGATGPRRDTTYDYDATGNLTHKSDLGAATLVYGTPTPEGLRRPHALTGVGTEIYDYDANGNQTKRPGATLTYNALDQPKTIVAANQPTTELFYDALGQRVRKRAFGSAETVTFDELYERRRLGNDTKHTFYVRAGGALVAVVERSMQGTVVTGTTTRYVHANHQGSVDVVTNASGAVLQQRSYDPFGRARNPAWSTGAPPQGAALLRRGFTEHEHDDEFGLVNMRGRTYDPRLGRFLQADPFVPQPLNGQSYNRYSYVLNSPPNRVDPSGYLDCANETCPKNDQLPGGVVLGADGVYHTDDKDPTFWVDEVTITPGGSHREQGPPSGLTDPFPFGGGPAGGQGTMNDTDTTGCRGCDRGLDERRGGRWGGGASGGWQSATDPGPQRSSEAHSPSPGYATDDAFGSAGGCSSACERPARGLPLPSNRYGDRRTAAFAAITYYNPWSIAHDREVGGLIFQRQDGSFGFTGPNPTSHKQEHRVMPIPMQDDKVLRQLPDGANPVGDYHTHGDELSFFQSLYMHTDDEHFSPDDMNNSRMAAGVPISGPPGPITGIAAWNPDRAWKSYLGTPKGNFVEFSPAQNRTMQWGPYPGLLTP